MGRKRPTAKTGGEGNQPRILLLSLLAAYPLLTLYALYGGPIIYLPHLSG